MDVYVRSFFGVLGGNVIRAPFLVQELIDLIGSVDKPGTYYPSVDSAALTGLR